MQRHVEKDMFAHLLCLGPGSFGSALQVATLLALGSPVYSQYPQGKAMSFTACPPSTLAPVKLCTAA